MFAVVSYQCFRQLKNATKLYIFVLLALLLASCSVSRRVERRGGYLLTQNIVRTDHVSISQSDLLNFAQPKPNRKFLGLLRTRVWIWDAFHNNTGSRFNRWILNNFAEAPIVLDTLLVHNSLIPMKQYLANKGFFTGEMTSSVAIKNGKAKVYYYTHTDEPFKFGNIERIITDDTIRKIVLSSNSLISTGLQYDAYLMTAERDRITQLLRNSGYYAFTSDFIYFEVDTTGRHKKADIKLVVLNRNGSSYVQDRNQSLEGQSGGLPHKRYLINKIYINSDLPKVEDTLRKLDTLQYFRSASDTLPLFYQTYRQSLRLRPIALSRALFVKPGEYFSQRNINQTYNRIQNLGLSNYVSVNVKPASDTSIAVGEYEELLDCEVRMVRSKVNEYTISPELTNIEGMIGLGGGISFRNRNIFMGAETFRFRAFGGFEIKPSLGEEDKDTHLGIFNSLEAGFETGVDFPTLITPIKFRSQYQNARPKTSLGLGFNYELRSQYERYLSKVSLFYEWNASDVSKHFFSPVDLSSISIVRDSAFTNRLLSLKDPRFFNQYSNHLILAMKYSYVFNNQNLSNRSNFFYFRINAEPAGNLLNLLSNVTNATRDEEGKFTLMRIRYAQYFRTDLDFRFYKPVMVHQQVVYRFAFGIGIPYGNSISLPFEKGFFAGGANGMRGWPVRSLGPGEYSSDNSNFLENVGDLWLEGNIEYRFPMYRYLRGALFTDIGNIWLLDENTDFPGGTFKWNTLVRSLAVDVGMGLRFDFSIFIFRIDGGLKLYDPALPLGNRMFLPTGFQLKDINWNFGIGYPF